MAKKSKVLAKPMEVKTYVVTDAAGPYVAGKRVKAGQQLRLTDRQAMYEIDRGLVRLATDKDLVPAAKAGLTPMAGMDQITGGLLDGWDHVGQSVLNLFTTRFFSRVMRPYVGSNVIRLLGENVNEQTVSRIRVGIAVALDLFEPRLEPYRVDLVDFDRTGDSSWIIEGIYIPRALYGDMTPAGVRTLTIDPRYLNAALVTTDTP